MDDLDALMYGVNNATAAINGAMGYASAADLSRKNRNFYKEEWEKQRVWNEQQTAIAREYNTSERIAAQDWSRSMWFDAFNAQNEYNAPSAQMQRMVEAGINPNAAAAAIGAGHASSPSVPSSSGASSPVPSNPNPSVPQAFNPADSFASMINANANAASQFAQARLSSSMADKTDAETLGVLVDNHYKPFAKQSDLDHAYAEISLMVKQGELSDQQATNLRSTLDSIVGLNYAQINKLVADANVAAAEVGRVQETIKLLTEQIKTEKHHQKQLDAAAYQAYMAGDEHKSAIDVNGTQMSLNDAEEALKEATAEEQRLKNQWREHCQSLGYSPDSKHLDRLIDGTGSNVRLLMNYGNRLIDGAKQQAHSVSNFFSGTVLPSAKGAAKDVYTGYKDVKQYGTKWSKLWNK